MSVPIVPFARSGQQMASSPGSQVSSSPTLVSYPQNDRIIQDISGKLFSSKFLRELLLVCENTLRGTRKACRCTVSNYLSDINIRKNLVEKKSCNIYQ